MRLQMRARTGHPDFLDLPWDQPLEEWDHERLVVIPRGLHRHVVRFVRYDQALYVIKELPRRYADREWRFLRRLAEEEVPVVEAVGVVIERRTSDGERLDAALITRHLEYSLPYRLLFMRREARELREPMLDALVDLLVRIHLVGFLWGDCSLSNTLFRRDAGKLAAYVVDVETGEMHPELTDGQRTFDIETAIERCAGELFDLAAAGLLQVDLDAGGLAEEVRERYARLWDELTRVDVFEADERHKIEERLRRINELGYDVDELELIEDDDGGGTRLKLQVRVLEPGRHGRRLYDLTGLRVQENQARRLLNDIDNFGAWLRHRDGRDYSPASVAHQWLEQSFEPTVAAVPEDLRGRREPAEIYHEVLEHWYFKSAIEGHDMQLVDAARSYAETVLPEQPEERVAMDAELDDEGGAGLEDEGGAGPGNDGLEDARLADAREDDVSSAGP